jgi:uncharacterized protein (TIGR03086 family)
VHDEAPNYDRALPSLAPPEEMVMADVVALYRCAMEEFARRVHGVPDDAWSDPTPNDEWDVRALVNHLVGENLWAPPLLAGSTVDEVGDSFDGDLLGDEPVEAWDLSADEALAAAEGADLQATVHLSFGDVPAAEYLWQLTADAAVHAWDLARATGQSEQLDATVVAGVAEWFAGVEDMYRTAGAIGPAVEITGGPQDVLLGRFGRDPAPRPAAG